MSHCCNIQQQVEYLQQKEASEESLIQFYVYQDLQNLINLIYSRQAVLSYFDNNPNHPMVILSNNKIILQLNLSSGIHKDLNQQYKGNKKLTQIVQYERSIALKTLEKVLINIQGNLGSQIFNHSKTNNSLELQFEQFRINYKENNFGSSEFQLQSTNQVTQFDEQVLQKTISSIQAIDFQVTDIRQNNNYQKPSYSQIISRAEEYQRMTKEKLQKIPQNQNAINSIKNQEGFSADRINQSQPKISNSQNQILDKNTDIIKQHFFQFFSFLGYFNESDLQYNFYKELENFKTKAKQYDSTSLSKQQKEFKIKLEQKGILDQNLKLYYYFEQFIDFSQLAKQLSNVSPMEIFRKLITDNQKKEKKICKRFFEYLICQKTLIEKQLQDQNLNSNNIKTMTQLETSNLSNQIIFNYEYVYQMFNGYYQYNIKSQ